MRGVKFLTQEMDKKRKGGFALQIRLEYYRNTSWLSAAARTAGAR